MNAIGAATPSRFGVVALFVVTVILAIPALASADGLGLEQRGSLLLEPCPIPEVGGEMLCGSYEVFENRGAQTGRRVSLNERLERSPITVTIEHPDNGVSVSVSIEREAFTEVIRYLLNSVDDSRYLPHLIHQAYLGKYEPLAQLAVEKNHFYRNALKTGMLLSVVCPGDVARINPNDIPRLTNNTFMGDRRVRDTMNVCDIWPQTRLPSSYGDPIRSNVPLLLWSGTMDPSNPPMWGEEAARHLSNSLHLVVPGCHVIGGDCFEQVGAEFLAEASAESLDTSCVSGIRLPPFYQPGGG